MDYLYLLTGIAVMMATMATMYFMVVHEKRMYRGDGGIKI